MNHKLDPDPFGLNTYPDLDQNNGWYPYLNMLNPDQFLQDVAKSASKKKIFIFYSFQLFILRRKTEVEVARRLEEQEEKGVELEKTYSSLQQEVEIKTRKLRKLFSKLQTTKQVCAQGF